MEWKTERRGKAIPIQPVRRSVKWNIQKVEGDLELKIKYMSYGNQPHGIFCCKLHSFFGYVYSKTLQLLN